MNLWDPAFWAAVGQLICAGASIAALFYAIRTYHNSQKFLHYAELDHMYSDLLTLGVEHPFLRCPAMLSSEVERLQYDAYAYMIWNFLETIHDRCQSDPTLCETWLPVIDAENRLHRAWFDAPENAHKFKDAFRAFIHARFPASKIPPAHFQPKGSGTKSPQPGDQRPGSC